MEVYLIVNSVVGYLLSLMYESIASNWHAYKIKAWIFVIVCFGMGTWGAVLDGSLKFSPLAWNSFDSVFASLATILQWGGVILGAGLASFKLFIHKKKVQ